MVGVATEMVGIVGITIISQVGAIGPIDQVTIGPESMNIIGINIQMKILNQSYHHASSTHYFSSILYSG